MNRKNALSVVVSLSRPGKMPCPSYSLPATACKVGGKLRDVPGSVCSGCYAMKGCYRFGNVQKVLAKRLAAIRSPLFVEAITSLIKDNRFFRWHDSGDLQNLTHFKKIIKICEATPYTRHWLPTKEKGIIKKFISGGGVLPENLVIRLSGYMVDDTPPSVRGLPGVLTSTVHKDEEPHGRECPAPKQNGMCDDCRACWNEDVKNISYIKH